MRSWRLLWVLCICSLLLPYSSAVSGADILTPQERAWLQAHDGKIRLAPVPNYPPIDFIDDKGRFAGLTEDYARLVEQRLGFRFERVRTASFPDLIEGLRARTVDLTGSVSLAEERKAFLDFLPPHVRVQKVIVVRDDHELKVPLTLEDLSGKRVALVEGYQVSEMIREKYPLLQVVAAKDELDGLEAVVVGKADAMVIDLGSATYNIRKHRIAKLEFAGETEFSFDLRFACRNDWPELTGILAKGLSLITPEERRRIEDRWFHLDYRPLYRTHLFWLYTAGTVLFLALLVVGYHGWKSALRTQVRRRMAQLDAELQHRIRAEAALRASETRHAAMIANISDVIAVIDRDGINRYKSPNIERLFGWKPEEVVGVSTWDNVHPDDLEAAQRFFAGLLGTPDAAGTAECRYRCKDGGYKWIRFTAVNRLHDPAIGGVLLNYRDITQRRRAREALRESEERYRKLFENMFEAFAYCRMLPVEGNWPDFEYLDGNRPFAEMIGCRDFIGKKVSEVQPERAKWNMDLMHAYQRVASTGKPEKLTAYSELSQRWMSVSVYSPETGCFAAVYENINERIQAEAALRESEERYRSLFERIQDGVYRSTHEGRFVDVNPAMVKMFGYASREEMLAIDIRKELYFSPEDRDPKAPETDAERVVVSRQRRKDGSEIWVEDHGNYVRDAEGNIVLHEGILRDVTERRRMEEEKARLQDQLLQAQKMESVGRLAGGVAHDFNNMLGVILGHAELALDEVDPAEPLRDDLLEIQTAAQRSANLTRQLLAFARKQTVSPRVLDLNDTVGGMLRMLQRLIGENIELTWRPGKSLWTVQMDPSQIDQILANLSVNARDAIAGAGSLSISTENAVLDDTFCASHADLAPGDYVRLAVSDTGCGMDEETRKHLFEPFFTTKEMGKGTGLGLATVYGAVRQNNGLVAVDSQPGGGTTFTIYLPRCEPAPQAALPTVAEMPARGTETILLVEDEQALLHLGRTILERHGYAVLAAASPARALEMAGRHPGPIHLLITDVVMPGMNGRELMERLGALRPENMKVLFTSGYTADVIAHHGIVDGDVEFLQKPFAVDTLLRKVRTIFD